MKKYIKFLVLPVVFLLPFLLPSTTRAFLPDIVKTTPIITTNIHNANHNIATSSLMGSVVHDNAVITGVNGGPIPTGTMLFRIFNNTTCSGEFVSHQNNVPIVNGIAESATTSVGVTGLSYKVYYNGNSLYNEAAADCEPLISERFTPVVTTQIHDINEAVVTSVPSGAIVHDTATVSPGNGTSRPESSVNFTFYTNGTCSGEGAPAGTNIELVGGVAHPSLSQGPLVPGSYSFKAHYNGGPVYAPANGDCEPLTVVAPPVVGGQWCSHGYWKQKQHFDNWVNYSPSQQFSAVFENAFPGQTLLQVLQQGGGGLNALGRDTVGELLNAGKINAGLTQPQVINMFNSVFPATSTKAYDTLHSQFTSPENCPLN